MVVGSIDIARTILAYWLRQPIGYFSSGALCTLFWAWIQRPTNKSLYVNVPVAISEALNIEKGETLEWTIEDSNTLVLKQVPPIPIDDRANYVQFYTGLWSDVFAVLANGLVRSLLSINCPQRARSVTSILILQGGSLRLRSEESEKSLVLRNAGHGWNFIGCMGTSYALIAGH